MKQYVLKHKDNGIFSIKDLEKLTGIKAHTLRIWEQRYSIVAPKRTETNIRYYTDDDLKKLLNISMLNNHGIKISKIAAMSNSELADKVLRVSSDQQVEANILNALTASMLDLDEDRFEKILSQSLIQMNFAAVVERIIYPFMHRIGILWQTGTIIPAQEHFISNLVKHKLIAASENLVVAEHKDPKKFVLYLPEGELHEIGLLFANYIIKQAGHNTIYLGQTVPFEDIISVNNIYEPQFIFTALTYETGVNEVEPTLNKLSNTFHNSSILIAGIRIDDAKVDCKWSNIQFIRTMDELKEVLDSL